MANVGMDIEKHTYSLLVEVQTGTATLEISMQLLQKNLKTYLPHEPAIPLIAIHQNYSIPYYRDTCSSMFIAALFTTGRRQYMSIN